MSNNCCWATICMTGNYIYWRQKCKIIIMYKPLFNILFSLLIGGSVVMPTWAEDLSGIITTPAHTATEQAAKGDWVGLEVTAKEWKETDGANWESWYYYGWAQLNLGKAEQAVKTLSTALRLSSRKNDKLLLLIADSYVALSDWGQAEIAYRKLSIQYPNNSEILNKLRNVIEQYIATNPTNRLEAETNLIDILKKQLTFGGFINNGELWGRYADLLTAHQKNTEARKAYANVLRLHPDHLKKLEWVFLHDLEHAEAPVLEKTLAHLEKLDPQNPIMHIYLAEQAQEEGNKRRAREYYDIATKNQHYPYQQAQAYGGLGDLTGGSAKIKALEYYQKAINIDPSYVRGWQQVAVILRAQGQTRLAQRYFTRMRRVEKMVSQGKVVPRSVLVDI